MTVDFLYRAPNMMKPVFVIMAHCHYSSKNVYFYFWWNV